MKINKFSKKRVYKKPNYNKSQKKNVISRSGLSKKKIKKTKLLMNGGALELAQNSSPNYVYLKNTKTNNYHGFTPLQLNCALLQYLVNEGHIQRYSINADGSSSVDSQGFNEGFIGFTDFPSLIEDVSSNKKKTKRPDSNGQHNFFDVYEGGNIEIVSPEDRATNLKDNVFKINAMQVEFRPKFRLPGRTIPFDGLIEGSSNVKSNEELDDEEDENIPSNPEPSAISNPEPSDIKISQITSFVKQEIPVVLTQDITYVNKIIEELKILLSPSSEAQVDGNSEKICDLTHSQDEILIIHPPEHFEGVGDVVIVGYPAEINPFFKMMVKNPDNPDDRISLLGLLKKTIFKEHLRDETNPENYCKLMVELYNALNPGEQIDKPEDYYKLNTLLLDLESIEKILTDTDYRKYKTDDASTFNFEEFKRLVEQRFRPLINGQYTRPNTKIRYVFQMFIKSGNELAPMVYNLRELEPRHSSVLEKVLELIKTKIPTKMGLLKDGETSLNSFYTYYRYGDFMYFMTEYIHPSGNATNFPHEMRRRITLEELIYSSKLMDNNKPEKPFWSTNRYEYSIKDYRIEGRVKSLDASRSGSIKNPKSSKKSISNPVTVYVKSSDSITMLSILPPSSKIIIFRQLPSSTYEIYYKTHEGEFFFMVLSPILHTIDLLSIPFDKTLKVYDCIGFSVNVLEIKDTPLFKVKWKKITAEGINKEINVFKRYYNYPVIPIRELELEESKPQYDNSIAYLVDKYRKIPSAMSEQDFKKYFSYLKHCFKFYPFTAYNLLTATTQLPKDEFVTTPSANCFSNKCCGQQYNFKFTFECNGKKYILIVNKHKLQLLETVPDESVSEERSKYVAWLFVEEINTDNEYSLYKPERIKNIKDIDSHEVLDEIERVLTEAKLYNESEHLLAYNVYSAYEIKNFHIHIFKKIDIGYYLTTIGRRSLLGTESRLERLSNLKNRMRTNREYFKNHPGTLYYGSYQVELF